MNKPIKTLILFFLIVIFGCQNNKIYNYHWSYETGPTNAGNFHSVGTGDFNGDGNLDIVGGNFDPGGLYVWFGNGNGNWKSVFSPTNLGDIRDIACGDINNDGFDDVICTSFGDAKGVRVFLSNGDGTWSLASFPEEKGTYEGVEVADLNYDGNLDVAAANSSSASQSDGGVDIWFGNGKGQFSKNYGTQSTYEYRDVAIADLNNDGKLDIIATQWGVDGGIRVWYGTNRAEWYSGHSPKSVGSFMGLTTADFDRDGRIDICATAYNQGIFIWYQTEDGKFTEPCRIWDSGNFWEVQAKDLDFDGDFDIVATSFGSDGVRIFRNDWKCDWHDWKNLIHSDKTYYGLILGDFNNDSRSDIAAANYSQGIHIWLQVNDESIYRAEIPRPVENDTLDIWSLQKGTVSYGEAIYSIFFDTGIAEVREDQKSTINEIAELIKKYPQSKIRIEGNADIRAIATKEFPSNLELSQSRANSVKNALSQKITEVAGINFDGVVGFSDIKPKIYDAKTPEELQLNRRADVIIEKMKVETDKEVLNKINKFVYADSVDIYFDHDELILGETSKPKGLKSSSLDPYQNKVFTKAFGFPEYIIGALDVLKVALWTGLEKKEFELTVATSGEVFIPNVGDEKFYVAGKTPSQVEAELLETLRGVLRKPNVEVDVRFYNAHQSSILGEIRDTDEDETGPGRYALRGRTTLLDFISDHGGPTKEADLTKVQIIQENGQSLYYNLWRTIAEADVTQNPMMDADQIVFIPSVTTSSRFVFVFGEVNNPGLVEIKEQSGLPIIECIAKAGNFTQFSLKDEVRIIRGNVDKPDVITVDLDRLLTKGDFSQNIKVFDRDIVYISRTRYTTTTDFLLSLNPTLSLLQTMFLINQVVKN